MMEKLLEQNEERNRQSDVSATTLSFGVRASNNQSLESLIQHSFSASIHRQIR